jgi:hypothetical protein
MTEGSVTTIPGANKQPAPHVEQGIEFSLEELTKAAEREARKQSTNQPKDNKHD